MASHTAAHYFLEGLCESGIDYLFCNLGTDHVSIIEEIARWDQGNRPHPEIITAPHEVVAVHMAGGYAIMTGKGQGVLVHVDAGTANAAMGMHNLCRGRVPVFLMAGRAPFTSRGELVGTRDTYVHFVQDPYDIGSIVRPYTKWEYCLPSGVVAKELLARGTAMMMSDPTGPVFMSLPRETLAEEIEEDKIRSYPPSRYGAVQAGGADPAVAKRIAEKLMAAKNPVAFCGYLGRKPEAVEALQELALLAGIRIVSHYSVYMNCPHGSPAFAGFDPAPLLKEADLGLLLDVDVPWVPSTHEHREEATFIHIDVDAAKKDLPIWNFPGDIRVQGDCATVLRQVAEAVRALADEGYHARVRDRIAGWDAWHASRRRKLAEAAARTGESDAIGVPYLMAELNKQLRADDIIINEAIRNTGPVQDYLERSEPRTFVGFAGGGLGFSGGMALGAKLACKDSRVIQIVGDGSYHFGSPDAVYSVAQVHKLPIFTIVLDNRGWGAVKSAVQRVYPTGVAAQHDAFFSRLDTAEVRRLEEVGKAFGAHGERVTEPEQVPAAIARCLERVEAGQAAVLTVRVTPI
jgi:acetolactate synthase I/II/III large subunit